MPSAPSPPQKRGEEGRWRFCQQIVIRFRTNLMLNFLVLLSLSAVPQTLPEFDRILLPVVTRGSVAGANGSRWETVVTVRNGSNEPVLFFPVDCPPPSLERLCAQTNGTELAPGAAKRMDLLVPDGRVSPVFLNVTKSIADRVFVQIRVHDLSRQAENFGTEIPALRTSAMKTTAGEILDIPHDARFRLTFRLYADKVDNESELVVRFVNESTGANREMHFPLVPISNEVPADAPITTPSFYREITDLDSYSELHDSQRIRIEIEPRAAAIRYWAFVTVTNNETQQVTTLSVH